MLRLEKINRRKQDEGQVRPLVQPPPGRIEAGVGMWSLAFLRGKALCMTEDIEHENSNRFEEYEWWAEVDTGFRGSGFVMCSGKENPDSDADLDVDGDDTLEYRKPQYTEADVILCTEEPGEAKEREALRGTVLNGAPPQAPASHLSSLNGPVMRCQPPAMVKAARRRPCRRPARTVTLRKITEDSAVITLEVLKAWVRELKRQLSRGTDTNVSSAWTHTRCL